VGPGMVRRRVLSPLSYVFRLRTPAFSTQAKHDHELHRPQRAHTEMPGRGPCLRATYAAQAEDNARGAQLNWLRTMFKRLIRATRKTLLYAGSPPEIINRCRFLQPGHEQGTWSAPGCLVEILRCSHPSGPHPVLLWLFGIGFAAPCGRSSERSSRSTSVPRWSRTGGSRRTYCSAPRS
jgi:hypothetical protein